MSQSANFERPMMPASEVRVFIANDNARRVENMQQSLDKFGLTEGLVIATTLEEAQAFIDSQEPHNLSANVLLLGGGLDARRRDDASHGRELANNLAFKYFLPLKAVIDAHIKAYEALGLTRTQRREIMRADPRRGAMNVAIQQLKSEALIVGTSARPDGALDDVAQYPQLTSDVAKRVYSVVVPKKYRQVSGGE